jgi:hypothetical protein
MWGDFGTFTCGEPRKAGGVHTPYQSDVWNGIDVGLMFFPLSACCAHVVVLLLLSWLQRRCVSCTLAKSNGDPPLLTGIISSTSALHGFGVRSVLSTGLPHIAHVS